MSKQAAHDFIDKVSKNPDIGAEIRKQPKDIVNIAKKHGHDFTGDELRETLKEKWGTGQHPSWFCDVDCGM